METQGRECLVPTCGKQRSYGRAEYCEKHYHRLRRHGDVNYTANRQACDILGCIRKHTKRGYHFGYSTVGLTYAGAHIRVKAQRGSAKQWRCHSCDALANHWAYDHQDEHQMVEKGLPYSGDPKHYRPMCVPCHKRSDLAR